MSLFLWPDPKRAPSMRSGASGPSVAAVEKAFERMYPNTRAVLFSSGRAALSAAISAMELTRADRVSVSPFSSHCVFESVGRASSPGVLYRDPDGVVVYHQWGFEQIVKNRSLPVIDDSADSLFAPGPVRFSPGSRIQLISLPKTIGSFFGGVLLCADKHTASAVKLIRQRRTLDAGDQAKLKAAGRKDSQAYLRWAGAESLGGAPAQPVLRDILACLKKTPQLVEDRQSKLAVLRPVISKRLVFFRGRLPCALPFAYSKNLETLLSRLGFTAGVRHFNFSQAFQNGRMQKTLPVPIHQEVPLSKLKRVKEFFS